MSNKWTINKCLILKSSQYALYESEVESEADDDKLALILKANKNSSIVGNTAEELSRSEK